MTIKDNLFQYGYSHNKFEIIKQGTIIYDGQNNLVEFSGWHVKSSVFISIYEIEQWVKNINKKNKNHPLTNIFK